MRLSFGEHWDFYTVISLTLSLTVTCYHPWQCFNNDTFVHELKERLKAELDIDWDQNHNHFCCFNHILNLAAQAALVHLKDDISKINHCFSIALHCPFSNCYFFSYFKALRSLYFYLFLASAVWISYTSLSCMQYWQYQTYPWLHYLVELNLWYDQDWQCLKHVWFSFTFAYREPLV